MRNQQTFDHGLLALWVARRLHFCLLQVIVWLEWGLFGGFDWLSHFLSAADWPSCADSVNTLHNGCFGFTARLGFLDRDGGLIRALVHWRSCRCTLVSLFFFTFCCWFLHHLSRQLVERSFSYIFVANFTDEVGHLRNRKFWNIEYRFFIFASFFGGSFRSRSCFAGSLLFFLTKTFFLLHFSFVCGKGFFLKFGLLLFSFFAQYLLDLCPLWFREKFELVTNITFKWVEEVWHYLRVRLNELYILDVVVSVGSLDRIQNSETFFKFLVQHYVMNGFLHLIDLRCKFVFLATGDFVVMVSAVCKWNLEVELSLL